MMSLPSNMSDKITLLARSTKPQQMYPRRKHPAMPLHQQCHLQKPSFFLSTYFFSLRPGTGASILLVLFGALRHGVGPSDLLFLHHGGVQLPRLIEATSNHEGRHRNREGARWILPVYRQPGVDQELLVLQGST